MNGIVVLVALAMAVGVVGTVVPFVPGLALIWAAGLVYGIVEGFEGTGTAAFGVMTLLAAVGILAGWIVPQRAAGAAGATRTSMALGVVLAIAGFFVIPVVGAPLGGVVGVYLGERQRTRTHEGAWRATRATIVGFGLATLAQFVIGILMALTWVGWVVVD